MQHTLVDDVVKQILRDGILLGNGGDTTFPQKFKEHIVPHPFAKAKQLSLMALSDSLKRLKGAGAVVELPQRGYLLKENDQRRVQALDTRILELVKTRWRNNQVRAWPFCSWCQRCDARGRRCSRQYMRCISAPPLFCFA